MDNTEKIEKTETTATLTLEKRKTSELLFYPSNPRKISKETLDALVNSIREFGLVQPLVINRRNEVLGGNQRLKALQILGITEVPVVVVDLPRSKEQALNLALNKIQGNFDYTRLPSIIASIDVADVVFTGFTEVELNIFNVSFENTQSLTEVSVDVPKKAETFRLVFVFKTKESAEAFAKTIGFDVNYKKNRICYIRMEGY